MVNLLNNCNVIDNRWGYAIKDHIDGKRFKPRLQTKYAICVYGRSSKGEKMILALYTDDGLVAT